MAISVTVQTSFMSKSDDTNNHKQPNGGSCLYATACYLSLSEPLRMGRQIEMDSVWVQLIF